LVDVLDVADITEEVHTERSVRISAHGFLDQLDAGQSGPLLLEFRDHLETDVTTKGEWHLAPGAKMALQIHGVEVRSQSQLREPRHHTLVDDLHDIRLVEHLLHLLHGGEIFDSGYFTVLLAIAAHDVG